MRAVVPPEDKAAGGAKDEREKIIELYRKVRWCNKFFSWLDYVFIYIHAKGTASEIDRLCRDMQGSTNILCLGTAINMRKKLLGTLVASCQMQGH